MTLPVIFLQLLAVFRVIKIVRGPMVMIKYKTINNEKSTIESGWSHYILLTNSIYIYIYIYIQT